MSRRSVLANWLDRICGSIFILSGRCLAYFRTASERNYVRLIEFEYVGGECVRRETAISMTLEEAMQDARKARSFSLVYVDRRGTQTWQGFKPDSYVYTDFYRGPKK